MLSLPQVEGREQAHDSFRWPNLCALLRFRAQEAPEGWAYSFLTNGEDETARLTYGELDRAARAIAVALLRVAAPGDRALLLYPPGLDFIAAFWGCLYAGVVAVPAYPPRPNAPATRLRSIAEDAVPRVVLTVAGAQRALLTELRDCAWLATDELAPDLAEGWHDPEVGRDTLAFLQYTSGSTAAPKGVEVCHGNLLANEEMIRQAFGQSAASVIVGWLPLYHDMGLIGNVLQPLYVGAPCVLMSPVAFLQSPIRWLRAISRYRGTTSGGPNFAYEHCVRRIAVAARAELDLSSWQVAFNGAEPVRAETCERFSAAFAPSGFRAEAFYPCYGLAEATLFVTGGELGAAPVVRGVDARALEENRAVAAPSGAGARRMVGCGHARSEQRVAIVSPTGVPLKDGEVGEIWVSGPSVARGYWRRPEETRQAFGARLATCGEGPYLRTGDLGFLCAGELFVTGRSKDLIILRGRNHYPQDIELTAERSSPGLRSGCAAAFTVEHDGEEQLVVVQEIERGETRDPAELVQALRAEVAAEHDVSVHRVVLLPAGQLPKTSSGKVQRHACRAAFLAGSLPAIATDLPALAEVPPAPAFDLRAWRDLPAVLRRDPLTAHVRAKIARVLGEDPRHLPADRSLLALGFDSLRTAELKLDLEDELGIELPLLALLEAASLAAVVDVLDRTIALSPTPMATAFTAGTSTPSDGDLPPSYGQRALWFLDRLATENTAYNLAAAAWLAEPLDPAALAAAVATLVDRHGALRTTFPSVLGTPVQRVHRRLRPDVLAEDARDWSPEDLAARTAALAAQPFDLATGPLVRVRLLRRGPAAMASPLGRDLLVLVIHHIVADFWSLATLLEELARLYREETGGEPAGLAALPFTYGDWVDRQRRLVASRRGEELGDFWRRQMATDLGELDLPFDRPRPASPAFRGGTCRLVLGAAEAAPLRAFGRRHGASLYMVLLAALATLLHRWADAEDLIVATPVAGRGERGLSRIIGYFINLVAMRMRVEGDPSFTGLLVEVGRVARAAFAHQDYPFGLVVEQSRALRAAGRAGPAQVILNFLSAPAEAPAGFAALAFGEAGRPVATGGWSLTVAPLAQQTSQCDLLWLAADLGEDLGVALQYDTDLFDGATAERLLSHFGVLVSAVSERADLRLSNLPLLTAAEHRHLVAERNRTATAVPPDALVHEAFAAWAERAPDAVALVFAERAMSYGELDRQANELAWRLLAAGLRSGEPVGLFVDRSPALVIGLLAILQAGGAYLPLDPAYPADRIAHCLADAGARRIVTVERLASRLPESGKAVLVAPVPGPTAAAAGRPMGRRTTPDQPAYLIYTSGSTGRPKGVVVPHCAVVNFMAGMDAVVGCGPADSMLAITSIAFDISVLELLWTLGRGARVILVSSQPSATRVAAQARREMDFSLFFFASSNSDRQRDKYRLLLEGARFADRAGFAAVWTPERHFHAFGGPFPSPSVLGGALAVLTERVHIRAGSVVLPLHDPIRVAEDWSVVDNLSRGRVGIAFASGWHADDFVFFPERFVASKEILYREIETVRRLWRGGAVKATGGNGKEIAVAILPRPLQAELPTWITSAGNAETFTKAGALGAHVLTHLLGQSLDEVAAKIRLYRTARAQAGHPPETGIVTLMLHTFVGEDREAVRATVRAPFIEYLRSSVGLIRNLVASLGLPLNTEEIRPRDMEDLLAFAFDRYFETSGLFGTAEECAERVEELRAVGVDEVACLIDFGVAEEAVLASLPRLAAVARQVNPPAAAASTAAAEPAGVSLPVLFARARPTLFQCTPSMLRLVALEAGSLAPLTSLRALLLGGEALPPALARQVRAELPARLINVYGPTETTVWSTAGTVAAELGGVGGSIPIGTPIANTEIYLLDRHQTLVPLGIRGEICIGGAGVAQGYWRQPDRTAERFVPDAWSGRPGARLYRTGDLGVWRPDGSLDFVGRVDRQVKVRGVRIELEEIEARLGEHPRVREAAVLLLPGPQSEARLGAFVVMHGVEGESRSVGGGEELRDFLRRSLPEAMVPSTYVFLAGLPRTPNGKVDRRALPAAGTPGSSGSAARPELVSSFVAPTSELERRIAAVWCEVLGVERVGVDDNFFDLGGHSLLMAQVHGRLREIVPGDLPLVKLLEHPTIAALVRFLRREGQDAFSVAASQDRARRQQESRRRLRERGVAKVESS